MTTFKKGDRVRRIGGGSNDYVKVGCEYEVLAVSSTTQTIELTVNPGSMYFSTYFELVSEAAPAPKTDEELANEYRAARKVLCEAGALLRERGYTIRRNNVEVTASNSPDTITIKKTITTIKEI